MVKTQVVQSEPGADFIKVLFAVLFPPLGVLLETGFSRHLLLNVLLTLLGFLPGIVHAVWIISRK